MPQRISVQGLKVAAELHAFAESEALPGSGASSRDLWLGLSRLARDFGPRRHRLLERRLDLQRKIDAHLRAQGGGPFGAPFDTSAHAAFLAAIGYLEPEGPDYEISPEGADPEFARAAAPQLVTPLDDPQAILESVNARWRSLLQALYETDDKAPAERPAPPRLDPARLARAKDWLRRFLDETAPLARGGHAEVRRYWIGPEDSLRAALADGSETELAAPDKCVGWRGPPERPAAILLRNNRLHLELRFDPEAPEAAADPAGLSDAILEGALTLFADLEDLVCAVDAADKTKMYRTWLALAQGRLGEKLGSGALAPDRLYHAPGGGTLRLRGRASAMARVVGLAPTSSAVFLPDGSEIPETMLDLMMTALCGAHDLARSRPEAASRNSGAGAIYVGLPKLHSPEETLLYAEMIGRVEECLGLPPLTLKVGVMVEERRLSLNLKEALRPLRRRLVFIASGLLDRTADEIRSLLEAGPAAPLGEIQLDPWRRAYERHVVDMAVELGFNGRAKVGRTGWSRPRRMADLLSRRVSGIDGGGATSVQAFSPRAAALLATQYHRFSSRGRQTALGVIGRRASVAEMIRPPLARPGAREAWTPAAIRRETHANVRALCVYLERWLKGVGFALIRTEDHEERFEDCATVRISAQHLANWLRHGVIGEADLAAALDAARDALDLGEEAFAPVREAALEIVARAHEDPNGYVHEILRRRRIAAKAAAKEARARAAALAESSARPVFGGLWAAAAAGPETAEERGVPS